MDHIEIRESLDVSFPAARRHLLFEPEAVLGAERGGRHVTSFTGTVGDAEIAVPVTVSIGRFAESKDPQVCSREIHIEATTHRAWFPTLEGKVTVEGHGEETQLVLVGEVGVPGGAFGRAVHTTRLRELAEMSVHRYLTSVTNRIRQRSSSQDALTGIPM